MLNFIFASEKKIFFLRGKLNSRGFFFSYTLRSIDALQY